ncbi:hypothetical protein V2A60_000497 [Cordyceps javanica]|uniref:Uncharacterized protein n=1 Tax=Cordyceps javanica TaxID=43265 RepID=A0A545W2C8_9HYPO|nr:hypothetical protein IF1G_04108 [Cordyceps javanica]TQW08128.1 hypothetical protein IF2G_04004 [Cordyceps javanica]
MRLLAIYALLASAATVVTAGPVHARKAAGGLSDPDQLDQLIRGFEEDGGNSGEAPAPAPEGGEDDDTTTALIITPSPAGPRATQLLPNPPSGQQPNRPQPQQPSQPKPKQPNPFNPAPGEEDETTLSRIITPTPAQPGGTQSPVKPPGQQPNRPKPQQPNRPQPQQPNPFNPSPSKGEDVTLTSVISPTIPMKGSRVTQSPQQPGRGASSNLNDPPRPSRVPNAPPAGAVIPTSEVIRLSFITITSYADGPAPTITRTERASTVTQTVTITAQGAGRAQPPAGQIVAPSSSSKVIEATPNKDGNGVGVSVISIFSPGLPAATARPPSTSSLPSPPPPAAEINKPDSSSSKVEAPAEASTTSQVSSSSQVKPSGEAPTASGSSTVVPPIESPSAEPAPAESSSSAPATTSAPVAETPDTAAPRESAVQGQPTVVGPTNTTPSQPAATIPPPLPIDLSGFTLSSQLDLGNLMIPATAGPEAPVVQT